MVEKKNLTMTLDTDYFKMIYDLVAHYQKASITEVSKTDLIKHLVKTHHKEIFGEEK